MSQTSGPVILVTIPLCFMGKVSAVARHARRTRYVEIVNFILVGDLSLELSSRSFYMKTDICTACVWGFHLIWSRIMLHG